MSVKSFIIVAITVAVGLTASTASAQITIPTVPIGNPGNAPDPTTGYGSVAYTYNIGQTEVTYAQYAAFLNAKAASDPFNLYTNFMASSQGGIFRTGSPGSYIYSTISGRENTPVNTVSFWSAARFANWMHNGQGNGDTETGAYTLTAVGMSTNAVTRNAGWRWAVTSENEWYKAAYHQPASAGGDADDYWLYPTSSNGAPTTAQANYLANGLNNTLPVGSFVANHYGAFDMGGNVWERNETVIGSNRGIRGGGFGEDSHYMRAVERLTYVNESMSGGLGFRLVQVPGPSSVVLLAIGGFAAARRRRRGTAS